MSFDKKFDLTAGVYFNLDNSPHWQSSSYVPQVAFCKIFRIFVITGRQKTVIAAHRPIEIDTSPLPASSGLALAYQQNQM